MSDPTKSPPLCERSFNLAIEHSVQAIEARIEIGEYLDAFAEDRNQERQNCIEALRELKRR